MRVFAAVSLAAMVLSAAASPGVVVSTNYPKQAAAAPAAAAPLTKAPIIVPSLAAAKAPAAGAPVKNPHPLPYPNNDEHQWISEMHKLQSQIESHETSLTDLNKQLEAAEKHKRDLLHAQKLLHSMVSLHQSETVLNAIDARVESIKAAIKKLGEEAEDLMRGRDDMKKELEEEMAAKEAALQAMRKKLAAKESLLTALCSKRDEVAGTVSEWRNFVGGLKSAAGIASKGDTVSVPKLPHPPSGEDAEEEEEAEEGGEGQAAEEEEASGSEAPKKAEVEEVKGESEEEGEEAAQEDTSEVTAEAHEIKATKDSIQELLNVHLPRITGTGTTAPAAPPAAPPAAKKAYRFKESPRLRRNRHY
mmetsp:Transcript_15890/g.21521  ORF Transcript_15890/g.21521 Transcript_15890/m.21521 type:complete len:361 (+) Transcript_15890:76-1158(+)